MIMSVWSDVATISDLKFSAGFLAFGVLIYYLCIAVGTWRNVSGWQTEAGCESKMSHIGK